MFVDGFGISGFKSFGDSIQRIGPLRKINLFIGQNNSGKSNILLFLVHHYRQAFKTNTRAEWKFDNLDKPVSSQKNVLSLEVGIQIGGDLYARHLSRLRTQLGPQNQQHSSIIERILSLKPLTDGTSIAWFKYEGSGGQQVQLSKTQIEELLTDETVRKNEWGFIWQLLTHYDGGGIKTHWIPETLRIISPALIELPAISIVPAVRHFGETGSARGDNYYSGIALIDRLAQLQNPPYDQQALKDRFEKINKFLRTILSSDEAEIEIPYGRDTILVHMDNKTLPLSSLGTGVHEVVILAAVATVLENQIICLEEPELHLHPVLQKKLARYLNEETNNQYFITTHSASLLDTPGAAIFHVSLSGGHSVVTPAISDKDRATICGDLGYHPSDLLQSNCIIWVEGPSDRIYLNRWLSTVNPDLIEGIHYSIMFYGGRLLSHLRADDPDVGEFISLRRLNRNIAIVIDSDRSKADDSINSTKSRVAEEFNKGPGFAWITKGKEIENYVPADVLEKAVKAAHPSAEKLASHDIYKHAYHFKNNEGTKITEVDKIRIAHHMVKDTVNLDVHDLKEQIDKLIDFIRQSNGL